MVNNIGLNDSFSDILNVELVYQLASGAIKTPHELQAAKLRLCEKYKLSSLPTNAEILAHVPHELQPKLKPLLQLKPARTLSGIAVVAVMTSPAPCPHGKCIYCPGGVEFGTAQSYTGQEPAALRAQSFEFDPYLQTRARLEQLREIGHPTDKIELIIMGGTFTARKTDYQEYFVKRCFDAMNRSLKGSDESRVQPVESPVSGLGRPLDSQPIDREERSSNGQGRGCAHDPRTIRLSDSTDLGLAHEKNESAEHRCIGLTIETRPDFCTPKEVDKMLRLGATRVELGVQTLQDEVLANIQRGHDVAATVRATQIAKDSGLKVCYHLMPGLPGATPETDLRTFQMVFSDERFRPDMLKLYPTLVLKGTKLYELWVRGEYRPYSTDEVVQLLARLKEIIPRWVRIQRIQRDIPARLIVAGVKKSDLRLLVNNALAKEGKKCRCIRCREARTHELNIDEFQMFKEYYAASGGKEYFLSFETAGQEVLAAYAHLRIPGENAPRRGSDFAKRCGLLRELKVVGAVVPISEKPTASQIQHRGLGQALLEECEQLLQNLGILQMVVMSGVGVRNYYRRLGYEKMGPYMVKTLV